MKTKGDMSGREQPDGTETVNTLESVLVEECEAFLGGLYAETLSARGRPVPYWGWLNLLAHGTEEDLQAAAAQLHALDGWQQGRSLMAAEVLDVMHRRQVTLGFVQRELLIPTEVAAMNTQAAAQGWSPAHLMAAVSRALWGKALGRTV